MRLHLLLVFLFHPQSDRPLRRRSATNCRAFCARARTSCRTSITSSGRAKNPRRAADGPFVVLFFGRLLRYKGLEYLLEAFRQLDPRAI